MGGARRSTSDRPDRSSYLAGHVARAQRREQLRHARLIALRSAASAAAAAAALRAHYGASVAVYLFGSVIDTGRFRLDSDIDLAVQGVPSDRYYEAWRVAEAAAAVGRLDLIRLEDAADWLVAEVAAHGERLA